MFSKVTSFFDRYRYKKSKKSECFRKRFGKNKNYPKFMEWKTEENTEITDSVSWSDRHALEKSKSDSSITAIGDCNYRNQETQISFSEPCEPTNITSALENLDLENNNGENNPENDTPVNTSPVITRKQYSVEPVDYDGLMRYIFKTCDISTKQTVLHGPEILMFQGNRHSPDEIARCWKKDCRMWLWKSFRLAKRQQEMLTSTMAVIK